MTETLEVPDYEALANELDEASKSLNRRVEQLFGKQTNDFKKELDALKDVHDKIIALHLDLAAPAIEARNQELERLKQEAKDALLIKAKAEAEAREKSAKEKAEAEAAAAIAKAEADRKAQEESDAQLKAEAEEAAKAEAKEKAEREEAERARTFEAEKRKQKILLEAQEQARKELIAEGKIPGPEAA